MFVEVSSSDWANANRDGERMKEPFTRVVCTRPFFSENDYLRLSNLNNVL